MGCVAPYEVSRSFLTSQEKKADGCKQRAGPWGAAHCGRCWLQPPEISAVPRSREQAVFLWLGILRSGASVIHHHCCPSKAAGSSFSVSAGSRALQFHCSALCEQHYVCYNLLSWQPPLASFIRSPGAGVPFVFLALQSHLTLAWKKIKEFCSRGSKSYHLPPIPMLNDLVAITRNAWKAFSPVDRLSLWSLMDTEHVFARAVCAWTPELTPASLWFPHGKLTRISQAKSCLGGNPYGYTWAGSHGAAFKISGSW